MKQKWGLVLEGGAFRGLFTAGITDVMMEQGVLPDGVIGVSAGAAFGCNIKSGQAGRALRYNLRFANDPRYSGWRSLVTTGNFFNAEFAYHTMPALLDPFDGQAFEQAGMEFHVVCTNVETGEAVYKQLCQASYDTYEWIRASASMPVVSRIVELQGLKLLDGGVADSIPLRHFQQLGYKRNLVILTQPRGYEKKHNRLMPLLRLWLHRYPKMVEALDTRHLMYNQQLRYVEQQEQKGNCIAIRPEEPLPIGHLSHDTSAMQHVYNIGRATGLRYIDTIARLFL